MFDVGIAPYPLTFWVADGTVGSVESKGCTLSNLMFDEEGCFGKVKRETIEKVRMKQSSQ